MIEYIKFLYKILFLLIPFHTLLIYHIIGRYIPYINYWKEILIILMVILLFPFLILKIKKTSNYHIKLISLLVLIFFVYLFGIYIVHPTIYGLYAIRNYMEPLIVLFIGLTIKFSSSEKKELIRLIILISVFISIWGIYQQFFISDQFLISIGYSADDKYPHLLHHSHYISGVFLKRNMGTFSYANVFGIYLVINIILLIHFKTLFTKKSFFLILSILVISLILTFSRSAILSLFIVMILFHLNLKEIKYLFLLFSFIVLLVFFMEIPIFETMLNIIERTISGEDPSTKGHLESFVYAINLIKENWFTGLGIGLVGPKAVQYTHNLIDIESSYLSLILDIGFFGFLLYSFIVLSLIKNKTILETIIAVGISFFFLPNIYELEIVIYFYMVIAILNLKNDKNIYKKNLKR